MIFPKKDRQNFVSSSALSDLSVNNLAAAVTVRTVSPENGPSSDNIDTSAICGMEYLALIGDQPWGTRTMDNSLIDFLSVYANARR